MNQETGIAILAPGLLGGSLALAARKRFPLTPIRVWARRSEAVEEVRQRIPSAIGCESIANCLQDVSLAILCMPVQHMPAAAEQIAAATVRPDLLVTDVGSVKGSVVAALEPILSAKGITFIGSHPMAGSHTTGMANARSDLFQHAACLLTPDEKTPSAALERLRTFWASLGCRVLEMSPARHDHHVARISHLPHVMAALTTLAALKKDTSPIPCSAGGFRDTTRVAAGDPSMWTGILHDNRHEVLAALQDASTHLRELIEIIESDDLTRLQGLLADAKQLRDLVPPPAAV
ncbi:MAG: prephenate dehydrogenase/arogenate dehydrogenase family protein [Verrucomicrobiaceae bacterium]